MLSDLACNVHPPDAMDTQYPVPTTSGAVSALWDVLIPASGLLFPHSLDNQRDLCLLPDTSGTLARGWRKVTFTGAQRAGDIAAQCGFGRLSATGSANFDTGDRQLGSLKHQPIYTSLYPLGFHSIALHISVIPDHSPSLSSMYFFVIA